MSEQRKSDNSSQSLLDQMEDEWDSPKPAPGAATERRLHAELDAAADRLVESLDPPPLSGPSIDELDTGWGDDEEDDDEEEEEEEPELPDGLDPVAYAAAKKAREERIEARREKRRLKTEAKKARRKARADAQRQKQKGKTKKARAPQKPERPARAKDAKPANRKGPSASPPARARDDGSASDEGDDEPEAVDVEAPRSRKPSPNRLPASKSMLSGTNRWMLGIAVVVFVAAAIFAAVITR